MPDRVSCFPASDVQHAMSTAPCWWFWLKSLLLLIFTSPTFGKPRKPHVTHKNWPTNHWIPRSSGRLIAPIMSMKEPCWIKQPRHNVKSVFLPIDDWEPMKVTNSWGNFCCIKSCSKKAKNNIIWQCWISGFYRPFYQAEHTWVLGSIFLAVSGRIAGNGNKIREIWWGPGLYWPGLY